jgi:hypothetical protein
VSDVRAVYESWWGRSRLFGRPGGHQDGRDAAAPVRRLTVLSRVSARLRRAWGRALRDAWKNLVLTCRVLGGDSSVGPARSEPDLRSSRGPLASPPPGHPERLVCGAELDAQERVLWADILGWEPYR